MTETKVVIAESGGSKTDWVVLDGDMIVDRFTTISYHPAQWNPDIEKNQSSFWMNRKDLVDLPLYFFGAGCFREGPATIMSLMLNKLGFQTVRIFSDVHAAGFALFGSQEGWGAIMGTGSVMFHWKNKNVAEIVGGKGAIEGDEGSGFYFGKLLLQNDLVKVRDVQELADIQEENIFQCRHTIADLSMKYGSSNQAKAIHRQNLELFIERYVVPKEIDRISIVGGYAHSIRTVLMDIFKNKGVLVDNIINRPIELLVEQKDLFIE